MENRNEIRNEDSISKLKSTNVS